MTSVALVRVQVPPCPVLDRRRGIVGVATAISKRAVDEIAPPTLPSIQLAGSVVALSLGLQWAGGRVFRAPGLRRLAALGVLNPSISYALSLAGLAHLTASMSVLLWAIEPVLILLAACVILGERIPARIQAGAAVALAGAVRDELARRFNEITQDAAAVVTLFVEPYAGAAVLSQNRPSSAASPGGWSPRSWRSTPTVPSRAAGTCRPLRRSFPLSGLDLRGDVRAAARTSLVHLAEGTRRPTEGNRTSRGPASLLWGGGEPGGTPFGYTFAALTGQRPSPHRYAPRSRGPLRFGGVRGVPPGFARPGRKAALTCRFGVADAMPPPPGGRASPSAAPGGRGRAQPKGASTMTMTTTTTPAAADSRGNADLADATADGATSAPRPPGGACWASTSTGPRQPTAHVTGDDPTTATPPGRGRIRTVQRDGTVVWTTPILEYNPALTGQDYDVLARLRDQARAHMARMATDLPDAA
jgi:hypothetical protein